MPAVLTYDEYRSARRFDALDGVRGLAILGVVCHHARNNPFAWLHGYRGVWVFFVLSGFLITTLSLREKSERGEFNLAAFMIRRIFRIMPLYYLALIAFVVASSGSGLTLDAFRGHFASYLVYCPEFPIIASNFTIPFSQSWSLGVEEKFYLVWPLLAFVFVSRAGVRALVTTILMGCGALLAARGSIYAQLWGSYTDILIGCLLAQALHVRSVFGAVQVFARGSVPWIASGLLALATIRGGFGGQLGECVYALLAAVAVVGWVLRADGPARILSSQWLVRVGLWSYAMYLTHPLFAQLAAAWLPQGRVWDRMTLPVILLLDVPLCWGVHTYIEKPLIALGRRIANRLVTRREAAHAQRINANYIQ